mgnify:CR=1 FL=1
MRKKSMECPKDARLIKLSRGKVAIVDEEDYCFLSQHKWTAIKNKKNWYAMRMHRNEEGKSVGVLMHREILGLGTNDPDTDHIDHNGLNNRKKNMRLCTNSQNHANEKIRKNGSSKYKGVSWKPDHKKWYAAIGYQNKVKFLGYFNTEIEAAKRYDEKARQYFGEFANCNFAV